jgi:hypothetical protein
VAGRALTRAQRDAARVVLDVIGGDGFCLAGGAALVASGLSDRPTRDIDAFTDRDLDITVAAQQAARALGDAGFDVQVERSLPGFATLLVTAGRRSQFRIDLGRDHIEWPPVTTSLGPTLSPRELAANKVLALFGRVEPRDLADLAQLAAWCDVTDALADAAVKDPGFDPDVLAEMIRLVAARPDPEWPPGCDVGRLRAFGDGLVRLLES